MSTNKMNVGQNAERKSHSNPKVMILRFYRMLTRLRSVSFLILFVLTISIVSGISYYAKLSLDRSTAQLLFRPINTLSVPIAWVIFAALLMIAMYILAMPIGVSKHEKAMRSAGLINRLGEAPELVSVRKKDGFTEFEYFTNGVTIRQFLDRKDSLESALNVHILYWRYKGNLQTMMFRTRPGHEMLPDYIKWSDEYMLRLSGESILILGMEIGNQLRLVDLNALPHILIGGATGSGKSVELKCLLYQCGVHGWSVYLFDFKGGVDYVASERENYHIVSDINTMKVVLLGLIENLDKRIARLAETECKNIDVYNKRYPKQTMQRIVVAIDEAASVFSTKGLDKAEKETVATITRCVEEIARKGRAAGINLIVATQRPDADVIPGQIKSNMDTRISGRANDVLSRVIIDSGKATEIPEDIPGRFVDSNEFFFQGFDF